MAGGGFAQLPDGSVIVALTLPVSVARRSAGTGGRTDSGTGTGTDTRLSASADTAPGPRPASLVRQSRPGGPYDGSVPERRRWSAHADEPHTVRMAAPPLPGDDPHVRVLVHAVNRARALTRLRNLGMRAVYLRGNSEPPTADEITVVLHHPEGLVWRTTLDDECEPWRPIAALLRPAGGGVRT
jgi:hypothetical protein